ncbi:MAG: hypothetical protein ACJ8AG_12355 [Ktedonobacteraceae bacterium]
MDTKTPREICDMSINVRVTWQAHSLSNAGSNGSNRLMPRRQLLADGSVTDACSGPIAKRHHAVLLAEYLEAAGIALCPACSVRDGRRAGVLAERPDYTGLTMERILNGCGLCDTHGFLVTAKNAAGEGGTQARQRLFKHSLVDFSFALALPHRQAESIHLTTRSGDSKEDGQMLMKISARSGEYALVVRYTGIGIGMDTEHWKVWVADEQQRQRRHEAVLSALRDGLLSPDGAMTAAMLPHLTGLMGVIVIRSAVGRAPTYSPLQEDFMSRLTAMKSEICHVYPFETVDAFNGLMNDLIGSSHPALPPSYRSSSQIHMAQ